MLAWIARLLLAPRPARRRHIRRRYSLVSLTALSRLVRNLIIVRAVALADVRDRRAPPPRNFARAGFRRRMRLSNLARAAAGSRLRRMLRHRDAGQHIAMLLDALANLDAHAAMLARRARRGLTRLRPLTLAAPSPNALGGVPPPPPAAADTS